MHVEGHRVVTSVSGARERAARTAGVRSGSSVSTVRPTRTAYVGTSNRT